MQFWGTTWQDAVKNEICIGDSWLKRLKADLQFPTPS
jgi:hypothetical protein